MNLFGVESATVQIELVTKEPNHAPHERSLTRRKTFLNPIPWVETHGYNTLSLT